MYGPGVTLAGRYRLEERVGGGGMGEVWRGTDEVLGRTVAVKVMLPALVREAGFAERFLSEARAMASVNHPGVVDVHDYRSESSGAFLVMEYVEGEALSHTLGRLGRLDPGRTMEVMAQAADALRAVHAKGIVHRDIKPGNLMVRPDGTVVLTDFGIARTMAASQLTATGAVLGTAPYLSPEQALGRPATPLSDLYALGVVAYQCLSGQRPFDGDSPIAVAMMHVREVPPSLPAGIPPAARGVVERALAKDPAHRWSSAADLAAAARRAISAPTQPLAPPAPGPSPMLPHGSQPRPVAAPGPPRPTAPPRPPARPPQGRPHPPARPATVTISTLLLLLTVAAFGIYFLASLAVLDTVTEVYEDAYNRLDLPEVGQVIVILYLTQAGAFLAIAALLLLLAWLTYRGSNAARVWTVIVTVLVLCCCGGGVLYNNVDLSDIDADQALVDAQVAAAVPGWYEPVTSASATGGLLALLVATILLLVPPSHRYFRRPPPYYPPYAYYPR